MPISPVVVLVLVVQALPVCHHSLLNSVTSKDAAMQAGGCATGKKYIDSSFLTHVFIKKALYKPMLQQPVVHRVHVLSSLSSCACIARFLCM